MDGNGYFSYMNLYFRVCLFKEKIRTKNENSLHPLSSFFMEFSQLQRQKLVKTSTSKESVEGKIKEYVGKW